MSPQLVLSVYGDDGETRSEWRKPKPDVRDLRLRVLEVLETEGKSVVARYEAILAELGHDEADDHGRQPHQCVEHHDDGLTAWKPGERQRCAERHAKEGGEQYGAQGG